jgi:hypothetical protein
MQYRFAMNRHRRWLTPLLLVPATFLLGVSIGSSIQGIPDYANNTGLALGALAAYALALAGPLVCALIALVQGIRAIRSRGNGGGRLAQGPAGQLAQRSTSASSSELAWNNARGLRAHLVAEGMPAEIHAWEIVPNAGEAMYFDLRAHYARFYGTNETYTRSNGFFYGRPAFVLAGVAATAIGNAARRSAASRASQTTWREWQVSRVVVTNQRLVCFANGRALSFYYSGMTAVYPEVDRWTLVCEFGDTEPLLLSGDDSAIVSLMTILFTHGPDAVAQHPSLAKLG